jgi:capsule polysaccharide export protein KpsE/RkpR
MAENLEQTTIESQAPSLGTEPATPQDLLETIQEFEQYRQRLIEELTSAAQKAKLPKSKLMARLEENLTPIDATLETLRSQLVVLTGSQSTGE